VSTQGPVIKKDGPTTNERASPDDRFRPRMWAWVQKKGGIEQGEKPTVQREKSWLLDFEGEDANTNQGGVPVQVIIHEMATGESRKKGRPNPYTKNEINAEQRTRRVLETGGGTNSLL